MKKGEERDAQQDLVGRYLNEIVTYELLTKSGEERLGRAVKLGREAASALAREDGRLPTARRRDLQSVVRAGEAAAQQFTLANLRLVVWIAKRYQASGVTLPDLIQEGNLGLMHAVDKFDYRKGFYPWGIVSKPRSSLYRWARMLGDIAKAATPSKG